MRLKQSDNNMAKNELDDFLSSVGNEPEADPFNIVAEDPLEPVAAEKADTVVKEEVVPFNKDPKIQRFIEKELDKRIAQLKPTETEKFTKETAPESDEMSNVLTRIIGNDTPEKLSAIKDFKKALGDIEEKGAQRALKQLAEESEKEAQRDEEAQNELVEGFESIEDTFKIDLTSDKATKLRSEFIDFIATIAPKDRDGNITEYPDFEGTYRLFEKNRRPESNNRAKDLASRSMARSSDATTTTQNTDRSWKAVDKLFDKLSN